MIDIIIVTLTIIKPQRFARIRYARWRIFWGGVWIRLTEPGAGQSKPQVLKVYLRLLQGRR